jgi:hypothetical protein
MPQRGHQGWVREAGEERRRECRRSDSHAGGSTAGSGEDSDDPFQQLWAKSGGARNRNKIINWQGGSA